MICNPHDRDSRLTSSLHDRDSFEDWMIEILREQIISIVSIPRTESLHFQRISPLNYSCFMRTAVPAIVPLCHVGQLARPTSSTTRPCCMGPDDSGGGWSVVQASLPSKLFIIGSKQSMRLYYRRVCHYIGLEY